MVARKPNLPLCQREYDLVIFSQRGGWVTVNNLAAEGSYDAALEMEFGQTCSQLRTSRLKFSNSAVRSTLARSL